ncbi:MAG TPA: N-acetylmuramoyl-L-alanine amidase, partial [Caulobacteraceae bacterium]|nr:N-acetylmuramoyl-L-alanine amidase [Caulobacteraceae bacterium]
MTPIPAPSPNFDARVSPPDMIVLHYTGMPTGEGALARLCDPAAKVSAHYMVEEDGRVFALVPEERRAWHAGRSFWKGATDINGLSVGVEIVNPGHEFGYRPFPDGQIAAVIDLLADIRSRWTIPDERIVGHSDVAPDRKEDPGELFPWRRLHETGIGHFVEPEPVVAGPVLKEGDREEAVGILKRRFRGYGYGLADGAEFDASMTAV